MSFFRRAMQPIALPMRSSIVRQCIPTQPSASRTFMSRSTNIPGSHQQRQGAYRAAGGAVDWSSMLQHVSTGNDRDDDRVSKFQIRLPPTNAATHARLSMAFGWKSGARSMSYSSSSWDPYSILGVSRTASPREIKRGYYEKAKKYHPDLNPDDPHAKKMFQDSADAYELLSNSGRRAAYDRGDFAHAGSQHHGHAGPGAGHHADPDAVFRAIWRELGLHEVEEYLTGVTDDLGAALSAIRNGDSEGAMLIAQRRRVLILSTLVPLALFLRFPGLIMFVMRIAAAGSLVFFRAIPEPVLWMLFRGVYMKLVKAAQTFADRMVTK